ncbi:Saccharopine dehydrogenase NADP binding domain-containing protein [Ruegeria halocynthiae]|uniref:Saccharopine dehydrogenase NADP binding domain-containing protein n=1 Tax=Ruegeria halocynthiae TaxID=985054 RepID=A0A1H2ZNT9_9RHOB|nr:saccharopine dehydrogenase NADP-binding domain-containing protein [Ruegeria halocynthiae]SDX18931.1 Saccharopine dehydrogenase NADP binding domain-containing protein [Ruegeria halocynthiae]
MKVVIIGGYGVFGSLTARLLARDGHQLWLAGRHPKKGRALAQDLRAQTLKLDIGKAPEALFKVKPDVVIDAAGPFQHYGDDPLKVPRLCIANGCHYLDLSDSAQFTKGITALNNEAIAAGVFALSGASSVPGLSSCIVADLLKGLDEVDLIDIAILPGNRAPRGMSVIKSIVSGVGRPYQVWRNGAWQKAVGWTDRKLYELKPDLTRAGYSVDVPDIALLPEQTGARSVMFRAGLELSVMNWALHLLAKLRQYGRFELPDMAYSALWVLSKALYPFGSDRGGMQVSVSGKLGDQNLTRKWRLIAEKGHGPFVPGVMCRAILRELNNINAGARPCLAELPRSLVESAMADLEIHTEFVDVFDRNSPDPRGDVQKDESSGPTEKRGLIPETP